MRSRPFQGWSLAAPWMACLLLGCAANHPSHPLTARPAAPTGVAPEPTAAVGPASRPADAYAPRVIELGRSVEDRPLTLYVFGDDSADRGERPVLILGGIHGNEPTSAGVCRELIALLTARHELWAGRCVAILPDANPDGLARRLRTNTRLVDLNRNFPAANWERTRRSSFYGGDAPATEPETRALVDLLERLKPSRIVSVHSMARPCNNFDGPAEGLAAVMAGHNGYPVRDSIGYPTPGSLGSFAGVDRRIPTITLELPARQPTPLSWAQNREALLAAIRADDRTVRAGSGSGPPPAPPDAVPEEALGR